MNPPLKRKFRFVTALIVVVLSAEIRADPTNPEQKQIEEVNLAPNSIPISSEERKLALLAETSFTNGKLSQSEELYKKALKAKPDNLSLLVSLAATEFRLGNSEESKQLLTKAIRLDLKSGPAWLLLGMIYLDQKNDEDAFAALAQAESCDPKNPRTRNYLGIAAGRMGWLEASEEELRKAAELDPTYASAQFNLAVLYLNRTPPLVELARRHYQRALYLGYSKDPAIESQLAKAVVIPSPAAASSASAH